MRAAAGICVFLLAATAAAEDERAVPVRTAQVVSKPVADGRSFVGNVAPSRRSVVSSEFDGLVAELLVREGDAVKENQPLAKLRPTVLLKRLAAARAQLATWIAAHAELKNGSRPEEIREARARVDQADAELKLRTWKRDAAQRLFEGKTISRDELRDAELAVEAAAERKKEAEAILARIAAGPRQERIDQAAARVDAQRAEVERLEDEEERYTIRAPFAGFVVAEHTEVGQWLSAGSAVVEIVALGEVDVVIHVLEDFVTGLREGTKVAVTLGAIPDRIFEGTLHRIVPTANERARTFPVKIRIANEEAAQGVLIKAGMFARVELAVGTLVDALLVPKDAIVLGGRKPAVFAVDGSSRVQSVPVELGVAVDGFMQVRGEIAAGARVVIRGNERLRPGQLVRDLAAAAPEGR